MIIRVNGFEKQDIFITFTYNYHFIFCPCVLISTRYDLYVYHVLVPLVTGSWSVNKFCSRAIVICSSGVYHFYHSKRANSQLYTQNVLIRRNGVENLDIFITFTYNYLSIFFIQKFKMDYESSKYIFTYWV